MVTKRKSHSACPHLRNLCYHDNPIMVSFCKLVHFKLTCLYLFVIFVSVYIVGSFYWLLTQNQLSEVQFLETFKCPACFGQKMCHSLLNEKIVPKNSWLPIRTFKFWNTNNVIHSVNKEENIFVVLKKLASDRELRDLDEKMCYDAKMSSGCDVASAVSEAEVVKTGVQESTFSKHLQGTSPMFVCPSTRLIEKLMANYKERNKADEIIIRDLIQIWMTSQVNSEPLLFQAFPAADGWPFPMYHGACGRYVVVADGGKPLSEFYTAAWHKRTDLAYQLMKIAEQLTNNKEDFGLYLTDVTYDKFAVDATGKVTLVDGEGVIVVDKQAVKSAKPIGWEDLHESTFSDCTGKTFKSCHSFSGSQLCSHLTSDNNYYAVCRALLSKFAGETDPAHPDGLLHDIPDAVKNDWDLEYLLNECALPKRQRGRVQVVHKLVEALDSLRMNVSKAVIG